MHGLDRMTNQAFMVRQWLFIWAWAVQIPSQMMRHSYEVKKFSHSSYLIWRHKTRVCYLTAFVVNLEKIGSVYLLCL